jgi:hypothetical protein
MPALRDRIFRILGMQILYFQHTASSLLVLLFASEYGNTFLRNVRMQILYFRHAASSLLVLLFASEYGNAFLRNVRIFLTTRC